MLFDICAFIAEYPAVLKEAKAYILSVQYPDDSEDCYANSGLHFTAQIWPKIFFIFLLHLISILYPELKPNH